MDFISWDCIILGCQNNADMLFWGNSHSFSDSIYFMFTDWQIVCVCVCFCVCVYTNIYIYMYLLLTCYSKSLSTNHQTSPHVRLSLNIGPSQQLFVHPSDGPDSDFYSLFITKYKTIRNNNISVFFPTTFRVLIFFSVFFPTTFGVLVTDEKRKGSTLNKIEIDAIKITKLWNTLG